MNKPPPSPAVEVNFEKSLKRLEAIVQKLEDEEIALESSLKLFAEGRQLVQACEAQLQAAENRIKLLMESQGGELKEIDFEGQSQPSEESEEADSGEK